MSDEFAKAVTVENLEAPPVDPLIGRLIDDRYRIQSRIGEGGMGIVYAAKHEVLGSRVAIKVLRSDASRDEEAIARLQREAQAASAIGSEHIVDVRDFGQLEDGSMFIVMELVDGQDLFSLVRREPIEWRRARAIAIQLCDALAAAHERGIVHRDLKLENVLLTLRHGKPDFVKLLDFGIAKVQGGAKITVAGRVIGTPEYMSPEQCAGRNVDHRTDVYSLGVMLYEMLTGMLPFADPDLANLVRMQMMEKPEPPSQRRPDLEIPAGLEAVILRCLAKDPDARFGSMGEVADALEELDPNLAILEQEPVPPMAMVAPRTTVLARPTRGRRNRALLVLGIGAVAGIGAAVAVWSMNVDASPPEVSPPAQVAMEPPPEVLEAPEVPEAPSVETAPVAEAPPPAPEPPPEIALHSDPSAEVYSADGALLGTTPFHVPRPDGEPLAIELRAEGFEPYRITLTDETAEELHVALAHRARIVRPAAVHVEPPPRPAPAPTPAPPPSHDRRSHQEFLDPWAGN